MQWKRPLVEACVGSFSDALAAASAGVDRLELCTATEIGGLTPSAGLVERVIREIGVPVIVMIRPRAGGFCYDRGEYTTALRDAELAIQQGAVGIAFGFLTENATIDVPRCKEIVHIAGERKTVFHRAFDFVRDPLAAADQLALLGVTRLLTSGQQATALEGAELIRSIRERTSGQLEIMPGGGINATSVLELLERTGCRQIHVGAAQAANDGSIPVDHSIELWSARYLHRGCFRSVDPSSIVTLMKQIPPLSPSGDN
jgi:copper homeostasis protein